MNELAVMPVSSPEAQEARSLARELATAYRQRVNRYKYELGLSDQEAVAKADEPCSPMRRWKIENIPSEELTWADLDELCLPWPERLEEVWEKVKQDAREAVRSGDLAAAALEDGRSRPWQRALFLAIRAELAEGWQPRNGIERQLIDQMAQAQTALFFWQQQLAGWGSTQPDEAEKAAAMAERFHRMFVRALRALGDLRKVPLAVVVQNASQVNVRQQQVNFNGAGAAPKKRSSRGFAGNRRR